MSAAANVVAGPVKTEKQISAVQQLFWCVRRELWEHRWLYLAPSAIAGIALLASLVSMARMAAKPDSANTHELLTAPFLNTSLLLMGTSFIGALLYSLECLQTERRDRSILFWKSLPISDSTAVLSKASIPVVFIPVFTWLLTLTVHLAMLIVGSLFFAVSGKSPAMLWQHVALGQMTVMMFFHMVTGHGLWYAPVYAWLIMVSAWARRAALLWATVPIMALWLAERIAFGTSHVAEYVRFRLTGGPGGEQFLPAMTEAHPMAHMDVSGFFASPNLWTGLIAAGVMLFVAARLRKQRDPA